jgi:signal transduction histidine kinase/CheY-like chemotaxis protein
VLSAIADYPVLNGGSYEALQSAIQAGESTALEFLYTPENAAGTERWFVANANVTATDWQVLLFIPSDVLGASTNVLLQETSRFFIAVAAVGAVVILLCSFVVLRGRSDKRLLKQQAESNRLLAESAQRAEQANQAKSAFLSRMSHDIRTPINGIMGMTAIANKHTDDPARIQDCLNKIDSSSQHLLSLVNDVLDMSRIESGKTSLSLGPFDLRTCLENCASILEGQLTNRQITLVRTFAEFPQPHVIGDELHLRQVLINILGNAVKFTLDGGNIYFRAWQLEGNLYHFEIEDTGIGMKEEYIPHIFEAFTQEETGSRSTYRGTGLGMAITKSFVDLMGGKIWVESQLNVGSTFFVEIPLEPDPEAASAAAAPSQDYDLSGMKVLLVEDNQLNLEIAQEILEEQGVSVTTAENGQQAVDQFLAAAPGTFDAVLMDVMMPVMDGLAATTIIRESGRGDAASVPILAMTANAFEDDIQKTRQAGMNAHLSKPIQPDILFATLAKYKKRGDTI